MRTKDKKNTLKVGIFLASLIAVLMIMVMSIGKETSLFETKVTLKGRVRNVSNLKEGSYVELKGIRVGVVKKIQIVSDEMVEVWMTVPSDQLQWIKKDSKMAISTVGLVGDKFVEIYGGSKSAPTIDPDKDLLTSESGSDLKIMMAKSESMMEVAENILQKLDRVLSKVEEGNKVINTVDSLQRAADNLEVISDDLKKANMGQMVKSVNRTMTSMEKIMSRIEHGPGTMNSMIYDDSLHEDLRALLGGAQRNKVIKYYIRESIKKAEKKE